MTLAHFVLASGRSIELQDVRMSSTYGGLLEGYPFRRWNDRILERLVKNAGQGGTRPVHLVEPVREHPDHPAGAFGPVELLPAVTCTGSFSSYPVDPDLDTVLHYSALTVVWFQATPVLPTSGSTDHALAAVRWDDLAEDREL
ncbi:hypothetical protein OG871_03695 [Kitasatospora sp. NBC_00374]|uniref:hypothetical protein n=1 Tax=Kitasatospora sp. NBC_00374 TaxID=2975964 RepID=UPI0030E18D34